MVQYIHTPWRDRAELLRVRRQFYPSPSPHASGITTSSFATSSSAESQKEESEQRHAVSRVAMWVQRGSCPHMVESTGLLMAAILDDVHEARKGGSTSAVRLAYSAAFSRYVDVFFLLSEFFFFFPSFPIVQWVLFGLFLVFLLPRGAVILWGADLPCRPKVISCDENWLDRVNKLCGPGRGGGDAKNVDRRAGDWHYFAAHPVRWHLRLNVHL